MGGAGRFWARQLALMGHREEDTCLVGGQEEEGGGRPPGPCLWVSVVQSLGGAGKNGRPLKRSACGLAYGLAYGRLMGWLMCQCWVLGGVRGDEDRAGQE